MTIQEVQEFHLKLLGQSKESVKEAGRAYSHAQDGSSEMAESMVLESFKGVSDAIEKLLTYGFIPSDKPSNIKAIIVKK